MFVIFGATPTYNLRQIAFVIGAKTAQIRKKRCAQEFLAFDSALTAA